VTRLNRKFDPSPENNLERVRFISETATLLKPTRRLCCVPVTQPENREVKVCQPWESGRDWEIKNQNQKPPRKKYEFKNRI
jgi:hypothetical protein